MTFLHYHRFLTDDIAQSLPPLCFFITHYSLVLCYIKRQSFYVEQKYNAYVCYVCIINKHFVLSNYILIFLNKFIIYFSISIVLYIHHPRLAQIRYLPYIIILVTRIFMIRFNLMIPVIDHCGVSITCIFIKMYTSSI